MEIKKPALEVRETLRRSGNQLLVLLFPLAIIDGIYSLQFIALDILASVTAAIFLLDFFLNDREGFSRLELETRHVYAFLAFLVIAGLLVRVYGLGAQSMWFDESLTANAAKGIIETGKPVMPSGETYWWGITYTALAAVSAKVLGFTDFALRLPSAFLGAATIPLVYLLGSDMFDRKTGAIAAALVTFLTWEIAWSRQARMYQLTQFLYTATLLAIYRLEEDFKSGLVTVLGALLLLGAFTHKILYAMPIVAGAYIVYSRLEERDLSPRKLLLAGAASLASMAVIGRYGLEYSEIFSRLGGRAVNHWPSYSSWMMSNISPLLLLGTVGAALPFHRSKRKEGVLLLLATVPMAYVVSFHLMLVGSRYLYFLVPPLAIWTALSIDQIFNYLSPYIRDYFQPELLLVALTALVLLAGGFTLVPKQNYDLGINAPQPDFKSAYNYLGPRLQENDTLIVGWSAPAYRYLGRQPDYGLRFDMNGRGKYWDTASKGQIASESDLRSVINSSAKVWIVLDARARNRQSEGIKSILENLETVYTAEEILVKKAG
ncbi:MAG: glycosyltransferase family 39 protein [Candidatus Nanohaloarchaea archaeon]